MNPYRDRDPQDLAPDAPRSFKVIVARVFLGAAFLFQGWSLVHHLGVLGAAAFAVLLGGFIGFFAWWRSPRQVARRRARAEEKADELLRELGD